MSFVYVQFLYPVNRARFPYPDIKPKHYFCRQFDKDGSGEIDIDELRQRLGEMGCDMDDQQVEQMMREADQNGDGKIDIKGKPCLLA